MTLEDAIHEFARCLAEAGFDDIGEVTITLPAKAYDHLLSVVADKCRYGTFDPSRLLTIAHGFGNLNTVIVRAVEPMSATVKDFSEFTHPLSRPEYSALRGKK